MQKVASGKFLYVRDRRNRENCERMWARRPCFKESTSSCDPGSNRRSIHYFRFKFRFSSGNQLCANRFFSQYRRQWFEPLLTPSVAQTDMRFCTNSKRILLITVGYDGHLMRSYGFVGMGGFFSKIIVLDYLKAFYKHTAKQIPTTTKITCSYPFRMRHAPVSLQYNIPFSKSNGLASVLQ